MTTEEHYINRDYPTLDKFDKKVPKFDYYDLVDFAESYYQAKLKLLGIGDAVGQSEQYTCECKVCGKPFDNNEDYYRHYDEEHN